MYSQNHYLFYFLCCVPKLSMLRTKWNFEMVYFNEQDQNFVPPAQNFEPSIQRENVKITCHKMIIMKPFQVNVALNHPYSWYKSMWLEELLPVTVFQLRLFYSWRLHIYFTVICPWWLSSENPKNNTEYETKTECWCISMQNSTSCEKVTSNSVHCMFCPQMLCPIRIANPIWQCLKL